MGLKTKLAMALATSAAGAAMIAGGTFAYFSSTATNTANTFAAGTLRLTANGVAGSSSTGAMDITNAEPGTSFDQTWTLENTGTIDANSLSAAVSYTSTIPSGNTVDFSGEDPDFGSQLYINKILVGGTDVTSYVENELHASTPLTLEELQGKTISFGPIGLKAGASTTVEIQGDFHDTGAPQNYYQGASVVGQVAFTAQQ
ncbi:TasA family protein [Alicyclobacillus acidiphilus]|uniref:TasA family protein n=1 Tax=Alicyclobacillus acidiphilus TaxID=182455 RepID=UPI00082A3DB7|nr:TasA family protein [Alicyclobacillus acidiphilus]